MLLLYLKNQSTKKAQACRLFGDQSERSMSHDALRPTKGYVASIQKQRLKASLIFKNGIFQFEPIQQIQYDSKATNQTWQPVRWI